MIRLGDCCTMDGIIDGKPARDDRGSLTAQQRVNVNVNFPDGIISTVCVVVQHCDLQWLILQVLIINLDSTRRRWKEDKGEQKYECKMLEMLKFNAIHPHCVMH